MSGTSIIAQIFVPLSYHLSLKYLYCLFLSGRLRQVLLYISFIQVYYWHQVNVTCIYTCNKAITTLNFFSVKLNFRFK